MTKAETVEHCRKHIRVAHEEVLLSQRSSVGADADRIRHLEESVHAVGMALAALVDLVAEMNGGGS